MKKKRYRLQQIADALDRSVSTIWDELNRNRVEDRYDPRKAEHKAYVRRQYAKYQGMKIVHHGTLQDEVHTRILDDQSPEAIARRISRHERNLPSISKDAIYRYLKTPYGRRLESHRMRKRKRRMSRTRTAHLENRIFIDRRPAYINDRTSIGHAEADFIVSGKSGRGILLTVEDRKARVTFIEQILRVTIRNVHRAFARIRRRFPELRSMTTDNDLLWARHEALATLLRIKIYFCHPYHSWEKGSVENANRAVRRDIPKGSDISRYSRKFIKKLEAKLNRRPMKCLGYRTPQEMLDAHRRRVQKRKKPR